MAFFFSDSTSSWDSCAARRPGPPPQVTTYGAASGRHCRHCALGCAREEFPPDMAAAAAPPFTHPSAYQYYLKHAESLYEKATKLRVQEAQEREKEGALTEARKLKRARGEDASSGTARLSSGRGSGEGGGGGEGTGSGGGGASAEDGRRAVGVLDAASAARARRLLGGLLVGTLQEAKRQANLRPPEAPSEGAEREAEAAQVTAIAACAFAHDKDLAGCSVRFFRTKAKPQLFWKPRKLSRSMESALDAQEVLFKAELQKRELMLGALKPRDTKEAEKKG